MSSSMITREFVEEALLKMEVPVSNKGFKYIVDAVLLLDDPDWRYAKWTAIYEKLARMNSDTSVRVERAIRHELEVTRNQLGNYDIINYYIGFSNCENSNSITKLYKRLLIDAQHEADQLPKAPEQSINPDILKTMIRETLREMFAIA